MFRKQNSEKSIHNKKQTGIKAQTMSVGKTTEGFNCGGVCKLLNVSLEVWMQVFESWRTGGEEVKGRTNWFSSTVMGCTSNSSGHVATVLHIACSCKMCTHFLQKRLNICVFAKEPKYIWLLSLVFSLLLPGTCPQEKYKRCAPAATG